MKRLEIAVAGKLARRERLDAAGYTLTATSPPLYWKPAKHSEATLRLAEAGLAASAEWRAAELQALEQERQQLLARGRPLAAGGQPGGEAREGEDAAMHEQEEEDEEDMEGDGAQQQPAPGRGGREAAQQQGPDDRYAPSGDQEPV